VLYAAVGCAIGFYIVGSLVPAAIITVMVIATSIFCLFRVLASLEIKSRRYKLLAIYSVVFAAGLSIGICAQFAARNNVRFGITENNITAINGVLLEDPRIISKGRAMAALSLREAAGSGSLRASSSGKITVFFPEDNALRVREFGRGTTIFSEGKLRLSETGWTFSAQ
jgi:hypothetical protein